MAKHARQSSPARRRRQHRLLVSAVAAGALATAGTALISGQPDSSVHARVVSMPIVLVDHSCAATDVVCDLATRAPENDGVVIPAAIRPARISPGPIDPILARLLGAP